MFLTLLKVLLVKQTDLFSSSWLEESLRILETPSEEQLVLLNNLLVFRSDMNLMGTRERQKLGLKLHQIQTLSVHFNAK